MKFSYTEKKKKPKTPQALQKSPTRGYGMDIKNTAVFLGFLKAPNQAQ